MKRPYFEHGNEELSEHEVSRKVDLIWWSTSSALLQLSRNLIQSDTVNFKWSIFRKLRVSCRVSRVFHFFWLHICRDGSRTVQDTRQMLVWLGILWLSHVLKNSGKGKVFWTFWMAAVSFIVQFLESSLGGRSLVRIATFWTTNSTLEMQFPHELHNLSANDSGKPECLKSSAFLPGGQVTAGILKVASSFGHVSFVVGYFPIYFLFLLQLFNGLRLLAWLGIFQLFSATNIWAKGICSRQISATAPGRASKPLVWLLVLRIREKAWGCLLKSQVFQAWGEGIYSPSMSTSRSISSSSSVDGNWPRFLSTVPSSSFVISPLSSLSKIRNASRSSEIQLCMVLGLFLGESITGICKHVCAKQNSFHTHVYDNFTLHLLRWVSV